MCVDVMCGSFVIVISYTGALLLHDELPLEEIRPIIHGTGGVWGCCLT